MEILDVKKWQETKNKQFMFLEPKESIFGDKIDVAKRLKDDKIFVSGDPYAIVHSPITSSDVAGLQQKITNLFWISFFATDFIHLYLNFKTILTESGEQWFANKELQTNILFIEINDYEQEVEKLKDASVSYVRRNIDWINDWSSSKSERAHSAEYYKNHPDELK